MPRRKYPEPKIEKFDTSLIIKQVVDGDTKYGLTEKHVMVYSSLSEDWRILYNGFYNDLEQRWNSINLQIGKSKKSKTGQK